MRTKALVCALAFAASIGATVAQNVYSLNVVGYYNITVGANQKIMIANQLNTTNNSIGALLAPPMVDNGDTLFKFSGGFSASTYSGDDGQWNPDPAVTLNPGEAAFIKPVAARTLTFVGEVLQGSLTNTLPLNTKVLRASMVPQQGLISTDLGVPYANGDTAFTFNTAQNGGGYSAYTYSEDDGTWNPTEPVISVGQGFFYLKSATAPAASANWVRNFTVQ
jgi:hypothetical protein